MNLKNLLFQELDEIPEFMLEKVLDFVRFLKAKHPKEKLKISILSESSLQKDWLSSEEDDAWQNL